MKVFGIYEKIDGVDMTESFDSFCEAESIDEAIKIFYNKANYYIENFEVIEISKEIAELIVKEGCVFQEDIVLFKKYKLLSNLFSKLHIKEEGKYLIKYNDNYDDEFDISGFRIVENIYSWNNEVDNLSEYDPSYCFGSYEVIEYDSTEDLCNALKITKISDEQYDVIHKLFGESYGHFPI